MKTRVETEEAAQPSIRVAPPQTEAPATRSEIVEAARAATVAPPLAMAAAAGVFTLATGLLMLTGSGLLNTILAPLAALVLYTGLLLAMLRRSLNAIDLVPHLDALADPSAAGALIEAWDRVPRRTMVGRALERATVRVVSALDAETAAALTDEQWARVRRGLLVASVGTEADVLVAFLAALRYAPTPDAAVEADALAGLSVGIWHREQATRVRSAARDCLSALRDRFGAEALAGLRGTSEESGQVRAAPQPAPDARAVAPEELARGRELVRAIQRGRGDVAQAEAQLVALGPAGAEALLEALQSDAVKWRARRRIYTALTAIYVVGMIDALLMMGRLAHSYPDIAPWPPLGAGAVGLALAGAAALQLRNRAARLLARLNDKRVVGALVDALSLEDPETCDHATTALVRLLPRLTAADADLLGEGHRRALNGLLRGRHTRLVLAILAAYEQVGDESALPAVQALAEGKREGRRSRRVRAAAEQCLEFLQVRVDRERAGKTLVRASDMNGDPAETLVRPTRPGAGDDEHALLRPGKAD